MDLIGGNNPTEEQLNAKKWMKIIGIILVALLIISIGLIVLVYYIQATELKITVDGTTTKQLEKVLMFEDNKVYIPIRDFASYVGYSSYNGDEYSEGNTKCYVKNENETAYFTLDSNKIYKTDKTNKYEYYEIDEPVKMINGKLYTTTQGAQVAFNIVFNYKQKENSVTIYTLPYLVKSYTTRFANAAVSGEDASFTNQKAILYNMLIVKNAEGLYGVNTLSGTEIIGTKYTSIQFIESKKEFIVTTEENKMGILSYDATTKIRPQYDNIKQVDDKDTGLYLVTNNQKQGIVDNYGNTILYLEYDQIGIDSTKFPTNSIENPYLLYDTCIPVKKANLWGLFDKNGKQILPIQYDALGCSTKIKGANEQNTNDVLLIPEYEAIVVKEGELYGIVDINGKILVPSALTSVYSVTNEGKENYSMIYQEQKIDVLDYLAKQVQKQQSTSQNSNAQTNQTANETSNEQTNQTSTIPATNTITNQNNIAQTNENTIITTQNNATTNND